MSIRFLYELECHHIILGFEHVTSPVSCLECRQLKKLIDVHIHEWYAKCVTPACRFSKWTGVSQHLAELSANAHAKVSGHQVVKVSYSPRPEAVKLQEKMRKNRAI